jgi:hypothetical protein
VWRAGGEKAYRILHAEIRDLYVPHGSIAIAAFGRTEDVESGALTIYRAANNRVATGVRQVAGPVACGTDLEERGSTTQDLGCAVQYAEYRGLIVPRWAFGAKERDFKRASSLSHWQVNLGPMGRASNKGMVGLSLNYRGTSLALISAHFAADKKNRTRLEQRNRVRPGLVKAAVDTSRSALALRVLSHCACSCVWGGAVCILDGSAARGVVRCAGLVSDAPGPADPVGQRPLRRTSAASPQ